MDPVTVIQTVMALVSLIGSEVPKLRALGEVLQGGDQAALDKMLGDLQAENDALGKA